MNEKPAKMSMPVKLARAGWACRKVSTVLEKRAKAEADLRARVGTGTVDGWQAQWKAAEGDAERGDALVLAILAVKPSISHSTIRAVLNGLGGSRLGRLAEGRARVPLGRPGHVGSKAFADRVYDLMREYIRNVPAEPGYPCQHRLQKEYVTKTTTHGVLMTMKDLYDDFITQSFPLNVENREQERLPSYKRFLDYVKYWRPSLRSDKKRRRSDCCDACMAWDVQLSSADLDPLFRQELEAAKKIHLDEAREQRRAMQDLLATLAPVKEDFVQEAADDDDDDDDETACDIHDHSVDAAQVAPMPVAVLLEDFGGNFALPAFTRTQPSADYYLSVLNGHQFVIADGLSGKNEIMVYDERSGGKGGNEMATMRAMCMGAYQVNHPATSVHIRVRDNCCGQNKSNAVFKMDAILVLLLSDIPETIQIRVLFLRTGHSHMIPDRVVAQTRKALKGRNFYTLDAVVQAYNSLKNLTPILMAQFFEWEEVLEMLTDLPTGFTKAYYYEVKISDDHMQLQLRGWQSHKLMKDGLRPRTLTFIMFIVFLGQKTVFKHVSTL